MRSFIEGLLKNHRSFCFHCPPLDLGDIDFTMKRPPSDLIPIMTMHYTPDVDYQSSMSDVSGASLSSTRCVFPVG
jgi:hypothetical protein